jgi:hypothetical protein
MITNTVSMTCALALTTAVDAVIPSRLSNVGRIIAIVTLTSLTKRMTGAFRRWLGLPDPAAAVRARRAVTLTRMLVSLAGALAGQRHAHLREAWDADFYDPRTGELLPASRRFRLASGDVAAAARCRLDDAVALAWRLIDAVLCSWYGSMIIMLMPVTAAAGLVIAHDRFYGL